MSIKDPNWRYYTSAETMQEGYLRRRMAEYAAREWESLKGLPDPHAPDLGLLPISFTEPLLTGIGTTHKDPHRTEQLNLDL